MIWDTKTMEKRDYPGRLKINNLSITIKENGYDLFYNSILQIPYKKIDPNTNQ